MIGRPPRSTLSSSSAASDVYKRQTTSSSTSCQRLRGPGNDAEMTPSETWRQINLPGPTNIDPSVKQHHKLLHGLLTGSTTVLEILGSDMHSLCGPDAATNLFKAAQTGGSVTHIRVDHHALGQSKTTASLNKPYEALVLLLASLKTLEFLQVVGISDHDRLMNVLTATAKSSSQLIHLELSCAPRDDGAPASCALGQAMALVLRSQPNLARLSLSVPPISAHSLQPWLQVALTMPKLHHVGICGKAVTAGVGALLNQALASAPSRLDSLPLSQLNLSHEEVTQLGAAIQHCTRLTNLELVDVGTLAGNQSLAASLSAHSFEQLKIEGSCLGSDVMVTSAAVKSLQLDGSVLDLSRNRMRDAGVLVLAEALGHKTDLVKFSLKLRDNLLTANSLSYLCLGLEPVNGALAELDLSDNSLGVLGAQVIADWAVSSWKSQAGRSLILRNTSLGTAGALVIAAAFHGSKHVSASQIVSPLIQLDLSLNYLGPDGCGALGGVWVSMLVIESCGITDQDLGQLADSLLSGPGGIAEIKLNCNPIGSPGLSQLMTLVEEWGEHHTDTKCPKFELAQSRCHAEQLDELDAALTLAHTTSSCD
eukprot:TRINITY_DN20734_c0_g1_i1.p1 TRINITY_DN20734_c0_g1~~TRINITY_DN20734_c0_g1_i1.p1  ORF type:complete len:594 (-),score=74.23 TRINITY_DN20734_c0_g1_i1:12-1793(-)